MKASAIADLVGGELIGDGDVDITSVAAAATASDGEIAFFDKGEGDVGSAACVIVGRSFAGDAKGVLIRVDDPKLRSR